MRINSNDYNESLAIQDALTQAANRLKEAVALMIERGDDWSDFYPLWRSLKQAAEDERDRREKQED